MFAKNALSVFFVQIVALILAFSTDVVLTRALGPQGKGQYFLFIAIISTVWLFSNLGINNASVYFVAKERQSKTSIIITSLLIQTLTAGIGSLILYAFLPVLIKTVIKSEIPESILTFGLVLIPFTAILNGVQSLLLGLNEIRKYNYSKIITSSSQLLLFILFWITLKMNLDAVVVAVTISMIISCGIGILWLWRMDGNLNFSILRDTLPKLVLYGLKSWGGLVFQFLNYRLDVYIVNFFVGAAEVGYYAVAVGLAETIWYIPNAAATVLFPMIASSKNESISFTPKVVRTTSLITVFAIIGLAIVSYPVIVFVYGKLFSPAIMPLLALLPGIFFMGFAKVLASDLNGRGYPHYGTSSAIISVIVTIIFDLLLIPRIGILGAAVASTFSYGCAFIIMILFYKRTSGFSLKTLLLPQEEDFTYCLQRIRNVFGRIL